MKIAVLGTGMVGRGIAGRLAELGHDVVVGTRDPEATLARREPDSMGTPPFSAWQAVNPAVGLRSFADAARRSDLIVNATQGAQSMGALAAAGAENIGDKVLLDVAQALDLSNGMPPTLIVANDDSLGERIQRAYPDAKVVKALNTVYYEVMIHPEKIDGKQTVFIAGNDEAAKKTVLSLLGEFGWSPEEVFDLGDIAGARGAEMYARLFFTIAERLGTYEFNIQLKRAASA